MVSWLLSGLTTDHGRAASVERCRDVQVATEVWLGVGPEAYCSANTIMTLLEVANDVELLRVADYLLPIPYTGAKAEKLESILNAARSKWTVGTRDGRGGLVDRVPEGVRIAAESVAQLGSAGAVLSRAWASIHGLDKKPSAAYADAVRAVEIVAVGLVQPKKETATLGSVLGQMKDDADWALPLRQHDEALGPALVVSMLRTLWYGHRDRHGKANYSDVTEDEARAAVGLAVTLVDWFDAGIIARR